MSGNRNTEERTKKKKEEKKQEKKQEEKIKKNIRMVSPWFFCFLSIQKPKTYIK